MAFALEVALQPRRNFLESRGEYLFVKRSTGDFRHPRVRGASSRIHFKETIMKFQRLRAFGSRRRGVALAAICACAALAAQAQQGDRSPLVITSTNDPAGNSVVVFQLGTGQTPSLKWSATLRTGGQGGASTNAGIVQFRNDLGAVANYGSNTVTRLVRYGDSVGLGGTIHLAADCVKPDSVALTDSRLFIVGATCAESHAWPAGYVDGSVVTLPDTSAAQIAAGKGWAAVTLSSGSLLQLPLNGENGPLNGTANTIVLPDDANNTPLGEAFWGNVLGFTPAHSPDSFAIVDEDRTVNAIAGPTPSYPTNAPCWVAKGPKSVWYTGNSPGDAVSIFFSDNQGGAFYKSVPLPGSPTDITVSPDQKWLAVIYTADGQAYVGVFSIDEHGDLTPAATSRSIGVPSFSGVAFSE
jgi:hypothetical protein